MRAMAGVLLVVTHRHDHNVLRLSATLSSCCKKLIGKMMDLWFDPQRPFTYRVEKKSRL